MSDEYNWQSGLCRLLFYRLFFTHVFCRQIGKRNVREYDVAAGHAQALGLDHLLPELAHMSQTEAEHELFFSRCIRDHWMLGPAKIVFRWDPIPVIAKYENPR
jgi:hypothetical protein